jgi:hypothetical protein
MSAYNEQKLDEAKVYLRDRKIYIMEFPFKPTNAAQTDVAATHRRYLLQVKGVSPMKQVKK